VNSANTEATTVAIPDAVFGLLKGIDRNILNISVIHYYVEHTIVESGNDKTRTCDLTDVKKVDWRGGFV
jgi:hypothetical protein